MAANIISQLSTANTFQHWLGATQTLIGTANLLTNGNGETFFANTRILVGGSAANVSLNVETGATINVTTGNTVNTINAEIREALVTGNLFAKTSISMNTGSGTFETNEIVFQGPDDTLANANVTATVYTWDTTSNTLTLIKVSGDFVQNANTYGATSTAVWTTINTASGFSFTRPNIAIPSNVVAQKELYVKGNTFITGDLTVTGNLKLDAIGYDDLEVSGSGSFGNNLTVTGQTTLSNVTVTGNVATLNVTNSAHIGGNANVTGNVVIGGDLTVTGNITLDQIGFDDLTVSGSATIANNLTVSGNTVLQGTTVANANVAILSGTANTAIYNAIAAAESSALAFSIALG